MTISIKKNVLSFEKYELYANLHNEYRDLHITIYHAA